MAYCDAITLRLYSMSEPQFYWLKPAFKRFQKEFTANAKSEALEAIYEFSQGLWPEDVDARWMTEIGPGTIQITTKDRSDTYRTVIVVKGPKGATWIIGAFKKKAKSGIKTPQAELDTLKARYKELMK